MMLRLTIINKSSDVFRSPRIDIENNTWGIYFLKEGPGFALTTIQAGKHLTIEKEMILNGKSGVTAQSSSKGDVRFVLSSGFDEYKFSSEVSLNFLFKVDTISEEEYREIWMKVPKEEHLSFDINLPYSKIIEGRFINFRNN